MRAGGGNRSDGVPFVQHLVGRHDVVAQEAHIGLYPFGQIHQFPRRLCQIGGGHRSIHPWEFFGMARIDRQNTGMGMRAAQDLAIEHAWEANVRPIGGTACDLGHPIRADRAFTYYGVVLLREDNVGLVFEHRGPP
jgi:hypothetical protein